MSYDELTYWNSRACPNSTGVKDTTEAMQFLLDRVGPTILDWGAGIGRMFPAYRDAGEVVAVEIGRHYIQRLFSAAKPYEFEFSIVLTDKVEVPYFLTGQFDTAVASMVLLHQKPENINDVMYRLGMCANRVLVLTWAAQRDTPDLAEHCFNHDYRKICGQIGAKIYDWNLENERLLFSYAL